MNDSNWGLGVYVPGSVVFDGDMSGSPGGGPTSDAFCYMAPTMLEILDYNIVYNYTYKLILGNLSDIRNYVYANKEVQPNYVFSGTRAHWTYCRRRNGQRRSNRRSLARAMERW